MPSRQAKRWCWTLNNYDEEDVSRLQAWGKSRESGLCYLVFGRERGEGGTPHLQGYTVFSGRKSFGVAKALIHQRAHLEPAKGTPTQASQYCKKDGEYEEYGSLPGGQGTRSDLQEVFNAVQAGTSYRDIAKAFPAAAIRYSNGIQKLRVLFKPERTQPPTIWVFWGKTGVGKSKRVYEFVDTEQLWVHPGDGWFDGYDQQPAVLFDDFDGSWFKLSFLLRLLDRYLMQVKCKGAFLWWKPKTIFITSNLKPEDWYPTANENHRAALMRRLNEFGTIQHIL